MNKKNYEKYGTYFLEKFSGDEKLKIDIVANNDDMFAVYIYSDLGREYFIRIQKDMIYIDGCVLQDEGIEFEDIETQDQGYIYKYLDEQAEILNTFLQEGLFLVAYKDNEEIKQVSTDIMDRQKALNNLDIKTLYNKYKTRINPPFEELDRIELKDFYNNLIFEYNAKSPQKINN